MHQISQCSVFVSLFNKQVYKTDISDELKPQICGLLPEVLVGAAGLREKSTEAEKHNGEASKKCNKSRFSSLILTAQVLRVSSFLGQQEISLMTKGQANG